MVPYLHFLQIYPRLKSLTPFWQNRRSRRRPAPRRIRDHPFKTSPIFHDFWPLPPYHRHSSKMLMKGIFDPYVLWPFDHRLSGHPSPPKTCWRLYGWSPREPIAGKKVVVMAEICSLWFLWNSKIECLLTVLVLLVKIGSFISLKSNRWLVSQLIDPWFSLFKEIL